MKFSDKVITKERQKKLLIKAQKRRRLRMLQRSEDSDIDSEKLRTVSSKGSLKDTGFQLNVEIQNRINKSPVSAEGAETLR